MNEKQLEALCERNKATFKLFPSPYWSAEIYGFGKQIRKYGFYPSWLPLCVSTDHGAGVVVQFNSELKSSAPVQLFHSLTTVKSWGLISQKPCFCFYSPFVFYRKNHGVEKASDAKGTIAFPGHTTEHLDDVSEVKVYMDQLKKLPEEFQPVSICLHMSDINKGAHKKFIDEGFEVYTAGDIYDERFTERFYSIIRNFRYSTSNHLGSYTYYCVEMDIPFFIYGQKPEYINKDDNSIALGKFDPYHQYEVHRNAHDLFSTVSTSIAEEQRMFVNKYLGLHDGLSRIRMAVVLYYSLIRCTFYWKTIVSIFNRIKKVLFNMKQTIWLSKNRFD